MTPKQPDPDRLLKLSEVATLTDTPLATVRRWVFERRISVERVGPAIVACIYLLETTLSAFKL